MKYFKNENGTVYAYDDGVNEKYILSGLTEITEADALELAKTAPTQAELIALAEQTKTALCVAADSEIAWRQYAVDKGIATDEEVTALDEWNLYRVQLMRIKTDTAPDIEWPIPPGEQAS